MKRHLFFWALVLGSLGGLFATPTLFEQGRAAETAENYQVAIDLYRQAMAADPGDPAPAQALAELFTSKGLHDLALPAWKEVVHRAPGDPASWVSLAQTWSYLDDNHQSVMTLNEAVRRFPDDEEVTQSLAWMLFKTEDFHRGITLVENYEKTHAPDRNLEMTLGTLYSSVLDYDLSRIHYLKSLNLAPGTGSSEKDFRAIAWYNLSLLEKSFYQFDLADEAIRKSIEEEDRPAGALAWGELYQGKRDFTGARRLFEKAIRADETPLGRFDLARLYQQFGKLDEAEAQLNQVENHKDDTWIYNYGVTKDKLRRDLHESRADIHRSRFHSLDFTPRENPWEWAAWAVAKVREGLLWWYHDQTWKSLLVKISDSSLAADNGPEAWVGLAQALRDRPGLALKYLAMVRNHELSKNPRARASYLVEEGVIRRDSQLLKAALAQAQVPWENEDRERALSTMIEIGKTQGNTAEVRRLLGSLFELNPGALPIRGWGLPVRIGVFGLEGEKERWKAAVGTFAWQSGWEATTGDLAGVTWTLDVRVEAAGALWTLRDAGGTSVSTGAVRLGSGGYLTGAADLFRALHTPVESR